MMIPQTTRFRDRGPSARQLDDLLLIELAIREQANLDEERRPLARRSPDFMANARALARSEGWRVDAGKVDASVRRLTGGNYLVSDRNPADTGSMGCRVRLSTNGIRPRGRTRPHLSAGAAAILRARERCIRRAWANPGRIPR